MCPTGIRMFRTAAVLCGLSVILAIKLATLAMSEPVGNP